VSTTFHIPDAPHRYTRVPCSSPSMGLTCTAEERCGYCDDGLETVVETDAPSVNVSNDNAAAFLAATGFHVYGDQGFGYIAHDRIPDAIRRILRAVNTDGVAEAYARPAHDTVGALGARSVDLGEDADDFVERAQRVQAVLVYAADHGYAVAWD
jgi:hypothetical protein